MIKLSANYSYTNHNFVIQNVDGERINNAHLPAICIVKNILQRGKPTLLSSFLQETLGPLHKEENFKSPHPLIDNTPPNWQRIIRGDDKGNYFPAKKFFYELLPKYFPDQRFIQQLILPEVPINEITQVHVDEFSEKQVDFYFPQAFLIIEIDGSSHVSKLDAERDAHTEKYGIKTVRIKTTDLESENETFKKSVLEIKERIEKVSESQAKRRKNDKTFISLDDYKNGYEKPDTSTPHHLSTAIIRFQLTILRLLEVGYLSLEEREWFFEVLDHDIDGYAELAIEDLMCWFENLLQLQKLPFERPLVHFNYLDTEEGFTNDLNVIKIDFSLLKRYTDVFQINQNVVYVRTDYLDEFLDFRKGDSRDKLKFVGFRDYDYFHVSTTEAYTYQLNFVGSETDEIPLRSLLWNIFLQSIASLSFEALRFNDGQLSIIANALARKDTIGLLPTGSGKSVCFQLAAILQPAISFVVCPIKSLMYDQKADLDDAFFTRINHITSDDDGEEKGILQREFSNGKFFFIYISPERFQVKAFRQFFSKVNQEFSIAYSVIDEVHCLSEWGHDFRTSYLNLPNTISRLCSNSKFIRLTATASMKVLKDIQIEFDIKDENVKTPRNYARKELDFYVKDDGGAKFDALVDELATLNLEEDVFKLSGADSKCGIIFTQTVGNKKTGCYPLSLKLSEKLGFEVGFFSGSVPKTNYKAIMTDEAFQKYKIEVQNRFKRNDIKLLAATKAFGMGVNKSNIHYTVHYGIPSSMEALYQEAGRAGRDKERFAKKKAKCCVLFTRSSDESVVNRLWDRDTMLPELAQLYKKVKGDINTNLFLFTTSLESVKNEGAFIIRLHGASKPNEKGITIEGNSFGVKKAKMEKAIYRLSQLGIIEDWTISNFFGGGSFEVDYADFTDESIKTSLQSTIAKYDPEFSIDSLNSDPHYENYNKILSLDLPTVSKRIYLLLLWSYDNFAYNRRQSLKNIYENCCKVADRVLSPADFKRTLEDYFKFTETTGELQHIADNPHDYISWFMVFYGPKKKILSLAGQESLKNNLSRFLESYMYNTGLDLISGLLRLLLDDYENADGRSRLESSLKKIVDFEPEERSEILSEILRIGQSLDYKNSHHLSALLINFFNDTESLKVIHAALEDENTAYYFIENINTKLRGIKEVLYGRFSSVGESSRRVRKSLTGTWGDQ